MNSDIEQQILDDLRENPGGLEFYQLRDRLGLVVTIGVLKGMLDRGLIERVELQRWYWNCLVWRIPEREA